MIWLVWRQHRKQALFAVIGLAVLAAVLVPTGRAARKAVAAYHRCLDRLGTADFVRADTSETCEQAGNAFTATHEPWAYAAILLLFLPLLVGLFWGAPLVARETEQGTHRLVWTQGITRRQWLIAKLGLVGTAVIVLAGAYTVLVSWWMDPLNTAVTARFDTLFFDQQGVVPVAYTLFAVALGIFAGSVTRKVLPAMATTLVAFLAVRIVVTAFVRPNIASPLTKTVPVGSQTPLMPNPALGNWTMSADVYNSDGSLRMSGSTVYCTGPRPGGSVEPAASAAPGAGPGPSGCADSALGAYNSWTYQPGSRFWMFQWIESGLYIALAAVLLYAAMRLVRRRIS